LGLPQYWFGFGLMLAILLLPVRLAILLAAALPNSSRKRRIIGLVASSAEVSDFFMERLHGRFESL
jgi:hypothetical protein